MRLIFSTLVMALCGACAPAQSSDAQATQAEAGAQGQAPDKIRLPARHIRPMSQKAAAHWREDIDYFVSELPKRHIDLFHRLSEEDFNADIKELKVALPELSEMQAELELWRIAHAIGGGVSDGHTAVSYMPVDYGWAPLRFQVIEGKIRIIGARVEDEAALGGVVTAIASTPIEQVLERLAEITPYTENQQSLEHRVAYLLGNMDVLYALGLTSSPSELALTYETDQGDARKVTFPNVAAEDRPGVASIYTPQTLPVLDRKEKFSDTLWAQEIDGGKTLYVRFDRYPPADRMDSFGKKLALAIDQNQTHNLIIDMRYNSGGNGFTGIRLASWILNKDSVDWRDGVYVLIGKRTYSAAMLNALTYHRLLNAKLVGEPTGGNPIGYQDADGFQLPNSRLNISYSKRLFRLQDEPSIGVEPNQKVLVFWTDFSAGRDAALEWVLQDIGARGRRH